MAGGYRGRPLHHSPFSSARVKTALPPCDRLALFYVRADHGSEPCQATVRRVIDAGLTALGYTPEQREKAYQEYVAETIRDGLVNEFEGR